MLTEYSRTIIVQKKMNNKAKEELREVVESTTVIPEVVEQKIPTKKKTDAEKLKMKD